MDSGKHLVRIVHSISVGITVSVINIFILGIVPGIVIGIGAGIITAKTNIKPNLIAGGIIFLIAAAQAGIIAGLLLGAISYCAVFIVTDIVVMGIKLLIVKFLRR